MKVPMLVAINKIDKPDADIERVKRELAEYDLVPEEWGGKTVMVGVSAKDGAGIEDLLEVVLLSTDLRDLKANYEVPAVGVVVESHLQPGIGPVATVLVQNGVMKVGDYVSIGEVTGKVRTLTDHRGKRISLAGPSMPVAISGLSNPPHFGDQLAVFTTEKDSKEAARQFSRSQTAKRATSALSSSALQATQKEGQKNILHLILKADTNGSLEAVLDTLRTMRNDDVEVRVVSEGVGDVSEGDITMAVTSKALVIGFNVRLPAAVKTQADREKIPVTLYSVVYELFDAIREVLADLMPFVTVEKELGQLEILARFRDNKKHVVVGGQVDSGTMSGKQLARVMRKKVVLAEGTVVTVRRGKDEVRTVPTGSQCGVELKLTMTPDIETDIEVGDRIVTFAQEQQKKELGL
jgi:translation initiation factor IF-2